MADTELRKIFSENLTHYLEMNQYSQADMARHMRVSTATTAKWCTGQSMPRIDKIQSLCNWLGIEKNDLLEKRLQGKKPIHKTIRIPVLGRIAAGTPIEMNPDIIGEEDIPEAWAKGGEYFGLKIQGTSMEPKIHDGDIVIVRKQEDAESGDIVVAAINNEDATCKRLIKYSGGISLRPINADFKSYEFSNAEIKRKEVCIIGKVSRSITTF